MRWSFVGTNGLRAGIERAMSMANVTPALRRRLRDERTEQEVEVDSAHRILAFVALAAVGLGMVWSLVLAATARAGGRAFDRFQAVVVATFLIAAAAGVARLASGMRPTDQLHLIYGAVAVVLIPVGRSFLVGRPRRDSLLMLLVFVSLGGVILRLFSTG